jgi:hypothetical protein
MHHEWEQQNGCNTLFPRDIICLRNISTNTLHKGDDYDDAAVIMEEKAPLCERAWFKHSPVHET